MGHLIFMHLGVTLYSWIFCLVCFGSGVFLHLRFINCVPFRIYSIDILDSTHYSLLLSVRGGPFLSMVFPIQGCLMCWSAMIKPWQNQCTCSSSIPNLDKVMVILVKWADFKFKNIRCPKIYYHLWCYILFTPLSSLPEMGAKKDHWSGHEIQCSQPQPSPTDCNNIYPKYFLSSFIICIVFEMW